jgi:hypothetical protein
MRLRRRSRGAIGLILAAPAIAWAALAGVLPAPARAQAAKDIAVVWERGPVEGRLELSEGEARKVSIAPGTVGRSGDFSSPSDGPVRLEFSVEGASVGHGGRRAVVTARTRTQPSSFFLDDVSARHPILITAYGVAVTEASDRRTYDEIRRDISSRGLRTELQRIAAEPEETFEHAAAEVRSLKCQSWLGLGRDMRLFAIGERLDWIQPRFHAAAVTLPELQDRPVSCQIRMGRGWGPVENIRRRLEDGVLPILQGTLVDGEVRYDLTTFVSLERSPLTPESIRGTHYLVADAHADGHMFTEPQRAQYEALLPGEMNRDEETVLYLRVVATNTGSVPRYAWFRGAWPATEAGHTPQSEGYSLDPTTGFTVLGSGRVYAVSRLDGDPLSSQEVALLVRPGEKATYELLLPHRPLSRERAARLAAHRFEERHAECRRFWRARLAKAARVELPEPRIQEMIRAGLLHLDLVAYGMEPDGPLAATIGLYSPIGSETSPIVQFMDSMGWHQEARRSLTYFLDKQHDDGFMQNFGGYMLETGAVLWSLGEHYRYTRDDAWVRAIEPKLARSARFILDWRARNLREELRGSGYGMLEGKTADPNDPFRSFMLNGYHYLGLQRVSEMLGHVNPGESARLAREAEAFKADILRGFRDAMARSPAIPLGDGTWVPSLPPWVGYRGPLSLYGDGGQWFTHGAFPVRDSLLGPLYAVFQEVVDPLSAEATFALSAHSELMTDRNAAFSQPYYSRHPILHLRRGEANAFSKAFYNAAASLADRETYTFWEHYFHASPHKTHEEAWFLMESRWRLYLEEGDTLSVLPGIPRAYLEHGRRIEIDGMKSYFGPIRLSVHSELARRRIVARLECRSDHGPRRVKLRLPHPQGLKAVAARGGRYLPDEEAVLIDAFAGQADVTLEF